MAALLSLALVGPTSPESSSGTDDGPTSPGASAREGATASSTPAAQSAPSSVPALDLPGGGLRRHRMVYKNLTALRINPLGAVNEFQFGWRVQLVNQDTPLFRDSYFALKAHTYLNPAFGRIGPMLELQPLAILNLQAIYNGVAYFSSFDQLQSFRTPRAVASDAELDRRTDARYATTGHYVTLSALLQAKVSRVVVRDNLRFYWTDMALARDPVSGREDTVYYDQTLDILHPDRGWVATNDVDAIVFFDFGLRLGARYTLTHAFYRDSMYLEGEARTNPNSPTHRLGPAILYSPPKRQEAAARRTKRSGKRWYNPTAFLLVQWWASHRWRTGADDGVSAAVPYAVLGFSFEGDFVP